MCIGSPSSRTTRRPAGQRQCDGFKEEQSGRFHAAANDGQSESGHQSDIRKNRQAGEAIVSLHNPSNQLAFFVRAEVTGGKDGNEILPVTYDNNYVTVFPGETVSIHGKFNAADSAGKPVWIRVEGVNAPKELVSLQ